MSDAKPRADQLLLRAKLASEEWAPGTTARLEAMAAHIFEAGIEWERARQHDIRVEFGKLKRQQAESPPAPADSACYCSDPVSGGIPCLPGKCPNKHAPADLVERLKAIIREKLCANEGYEEAARAPPAEGERASDEYYPDGDHRDGVLVIRRAEQPKPDHRCGMRGFAESGDRCPACVQPKPESAAEDERVVDELMAKRAEGLGESRMVTTADLARRVERLEAEAFKNHTGGKS